jgi:ribosomal protein L14
MIIVNSKCNVYDNSGVLRVSCISLTRNVSKKGSSLCNIFVSSVKRVNLKKKNLKFLKGSICYSLLIKIARNYLRNFGFFYLKSDNNGVVLVTKEGVPVAKRFFSFSFFEIKYKYFKVALLSLFLL